MQSRNFDSVNRDVFAGAPRGRLAYLSLIIDHHRHLNVKLQVLFISEGEIRVFGAGKQSVNPGRNSGKPRLNAKRI